jgi:hypothetical protein
MRIWFQNEAPKLVLGDNIGSAPPKRGKRGHLMLVKSWTPKSVCSSIFADHVSEVHLRLSGDGESKDIGQYSWALDDMFGKLSKDEVA